MNKIENIKHETILNMKYFRYKIVNKTQNHLINMKLSEHDFKRIFKQQFKI